MSNVVLKEDGYAGFEINVLGSFSKQTYIGKFLVKALLSPLEFIRSDKLYRELLGNDFEKSTQHAKSLAFALSQLQYRIVEAPPFWDNREVGGGHIVDDNVITEVVEKAFEAESKYKKFKAKEAEDLEKTLTKRIRKKEIKLEEGKEQESKESDEE